MPKLFYSSLPPKDTLENTSWADIQTIAKAGRAADYWAVGDTKSIVFNSQNYCVQIIGFNHDDVEDPVAYGRDKAGITFQFGAANDINNPGMYAPGYIEYYMTKSGVNVGGWQESYARTQVMPEMKSYFQDEVQNVITKVKKVTSKGGNGNTEVITSIDDLWIPSVVELTGTPGAHSVEGEGHWYQFYEDGGSLLRFRDKYDSPVYGAEYWTRSPCPADASSYCYVYWEKIYTTSRSDEKHYITFCFCV